VTLLLDTRLWIEFTPARSPAPLKQFIVPFVLNPAPHLADPSCRVGPHRASARTVM
jgi:hypothetical protein